MTPADLRAMDRQVADKIGHRYGDGFLKTSNIIGDVFQALTSVRNEERAKAKRLLDAARAVLPVGFNGNSVVDEEFGRKLALLSVEIQSYLAALGASHA